MDWLPLNLNILKHPLNAFVFLFYFLLWVMVFDIITRHYSQQKTAPVVAS